MMKKRVWLFIAILMSVAIIFIGCSNEDNNNSGSNNDSATTGVSIVASTSWTASIARAAGAKDITILAPVELRHPPEYDFRPSDIDKVSQADFVIYAGYEPFMNNLLDAVEVDENNLLTVKTENTPENLKAEARELAEKMDTLEAFEVWEDEFDEVMTKISEEAEKVADKKAVVQMHMVPMAELMGFEVVAEFAEDLSPEKTAELAALEPDVVIDNYHNAQGQAIAEIADVERVELRNFPETEKQTIQDLLKDNAKALGLNID